MINLNTNLSSQIVQQSMSNATKLLNLSVEQMTTGYKLNHAKDNAANYSISTNMSTKISAYEVAESNTSMGLDMLTTAADSLSQIEDKLSRLRALQEQAMNGTYGEQSLSAINSEANAIVDEIERLYNTTEYNSNKLFKSSMSLTENDGFLEKVEHRDTSSMVKLSTVKESGTLLHGVSYSISTAEELAQLARMTNAGLVQHGSNFVLANDIDLKEWCDAHKDEGGWTPIGKTGNDYSFDANFDGNGYIISNLYINRPEGTYQGLFGRSISGQIKNLGLSDFDITAKSTTGALVGASYSLVSNCYVIKSVILGSNSKVGGLVGWSDADIINSYSSVEVTASRDVGGLVGCMNSHKVENCSSMSSVIGLNSTGALIGNIISTAGLFNCKYYSSINPDLTGIGYNNGLLITQDMLYDCVTLPITEFSLQVGINEREWSQIRVNTAFDIYGFSGLRGIGNNLAADYLTKIDSMLSIVTNKQTEYGAAQNRLESALEEISVQYENLVSSRSTLRDADISEVSSTYIQQQILQEASATLLATANQTPSIALGLI